MTLYAFVGRIGSGKTLSAVRQAYSCYLAGQDVWSNINLNFPYTKITTEEFNKWSKEDKQFKDAVLLLDEFYLMADSRNSMSKMNMLNTTFILQSRKKHVNVLMTSQNFKQLDIRIRDNTHMVIFCKFLKNYKNRLDYVLQKIYTQNLMGNFKKIKRRPLFCANQFYDLYNTDEIVMPNR